MVICAIRLGKFAHTFCCCCSRAHEARELGPLILCANLGPHVLLYMVNGERANPMG